MSPQSRQKHIAKFWSAEIEDAQNFEVLVDKILGETPPESTCHVMEAFECSLSPPSSEGPHASLCHDENPSQENKEAEMQDTTAISIPITSLNLPTVPSVVLKAMWQKAAELISTDEMIANCPGNPKARMVASRRGDRPHYVKELAGGKVTCDCYNYSLIQICAHSVAAAENLRCLKKFLEWRERCSTKIPNFSKLVMSDAPKGAGRRMAVPMQNEEGEQCGDQLSMTVRKKGLPVFLQSLPLALYLLCKAECSQIYTRTKTHLP